jgi:hypothetical protein
MKEKVKLFFFKKKNQKTSAPLRVNLAPAEPQRKKQSFFASLNLQKEVLACFPFEETRA